MNLAIRHTTGSRLGNSLNLLVGHSEPTLWLPSIAYVLMNALREPCLAKLELQNTQVGTICTKLLKLAVLITVSTRRILICLQSLICQLFTTFAETNLSVDNFCIMSHILRYCVSD